MRCLPSIRGVTDCDTRTLLFTTINWMILWYSHTTCVIIMIIMIKVLCTSPSVSFTPVCHSFLPESAYVFMFFFPLSLHLLLCFRDNNIVVHVQWLPIRTDSLICPLNISLTLVCYCYSLWTNTDHPAVKRARYEDSNNHSNHNNSNSGGGPNSSSWTLPNSPGQLSISSLSPPPFINGHSMGTTNGLSPSSSYDSFSPRGESYKHIWQTF